MTGYKDIEDLFTDRVREVLQLANSEAQRFEHEYVDTAHILLGLAGERTSAVSMQSM